LKNKNNTVVRLLWLSYSRREWFSSN